MVSFKVIVAEQASELGTSKITYAMVGWHSTIAGPSSEFKQYGTFTPNGTVSVAVPKQFASLYFR